MANATPNGKLTAGAIGNFLLGGAAALFVLTIGLAAFGGAKMDEGSATGAGIGLLVTFVLIVGGGITGSLGWFGLGSVRGGTNALAGIFSIVLGLVPILVIALAMGTAESAMKSGDLAAAQSRGASIGTVALILAFGVPALLGVFGGLGIMSGKSGLAKPAGLVMLLGGLGCALLLVLSFLTTDLGSMKVPMLFANPTLSTIGLYVGFFGLAVGLILSGAAMLGERQKA
ncbi:MAG: hypothetical protein JNJ59_11040 [Deltaproteobacteria bacterium]|nr:hypothetical protein [Deltaproteobacteria bacterium]